MLFRPFGLLAPKTFYAIWLSNLSILSVPNEGYSTNALCRLNLISTFIPVGFEELLFSLDPTEQKSFLSLGEDFIIVNDKQFIWKVIFYFIVPTITFTWNWQRRRVFISPRRHHPPSSRCCGLAMIVTRVTRQVPLAV